MYLMTPTHPESLADLPDDDLYIWKLGGVRSATYRARNTRTYIFLIKKIHQIPEILVPSCSCGIVLSCGVDQKILGLPGEPQDQFPYSSLIVLYIATLEWVLAMMRLISRSSR